MGHAPAANWYWKGRGFSSDMMGGWVGLDWRRTALARAAGARGGGRRREVSCDGGGQESDAGDADGEMVLDSDEEGNFVEWSVPWPGISEWEAVPHTGCRPGTRAAHFNGFHPACRSDDLRLQPCREYCVLVC